MAGVRRLLLSLSLGSFVQGGAAPKLPFHQAQHPGAMGLYVDAEFLRLPWVKLWAGPIFELHGRGRGGIVGGDFHRAVFVLTHVTVAVEHYVGRGSPPGAMP